jgi:Homing endonuclease associated repeat/HNH endonuclease
MKFELQPNNRNASDEELLTDLKKVAKQNRKDSITRDEYDKNGRFCAETLRDRFGSWLTALEKAGLEKTRNYWADEDYFSNLLEVWTQQGRPPKYREMNNPPSKIRANSYQRRFGTWRKALEKFVDNMNEKEVDFQSNSQIDGLDNKIFTALDDSGNYRENKRGVGLGLRYKVLVRDQFKCVKCGESPATKHDCHLHVDHKVPFSKGGKTTEDNLQTLCERCNLGKGDRHSE